MLACGRRVSFQYEVLYSHVSCHLNGLDHCQCFYFFYVVGHPNFLPTGCITLSSSSLVTAPIPTMFNYSNNVSSIFTLCAPFVSASHFMSFPLLIVFWMSVSCKKFCIYSTAMLASCYQLGIFSFVSMIALL